MKESFIREIKGVRETKGLKVILTNFAFRILHVVCPTIFAFNMPVKAVVIVEFFSCTVRGGRSYPSLWERN